MKHLGTVFWSAILAGSLACVAAGFGSAAGLHTQTVALMRASSAPVRMADVEPREVSRQLIGAHSFVAGDDDPPPIDDVVVRRPSDWAPPVEQDAVAAHPRLAIIVTDCGHALPLDSKFAALPVALTLAVDPDAGDTPDFVHQLGDRPFLVTIPNAIFDNPSNHALAEFAARAGGLHASGAISPLGGSIDGTAARTVVARLPDAAVVVDGMAEGSPTVYRYARERGLASVTRDIVVDAHDDPHYVAFMLKQAAALALHTGVAVAVARSSATTYGALVQALPMFERDGIEIVPVDAMAPRTVTQR